MTLKWGIIGSGSICHDFANVLKHLPRDEHLLLAIAASRKEKAEKFAKQHNIPAVFESYEALSKDGSIDIVYVGTLNSTHYEICKMLLQDNKHILCEKPLTIKYEHTEELLMLAKKKKCFLMEGIWSRFFPLYSEVMQLLSSNVIGDVMFLRAVFGMPMDSPAQMKSKELGGGTIFDLGSYVLQLAILVLGREPHSISVDAHLKEDGVDESIEYIMKYPNGRTASFCTHSRIRMDNSAVIYGTKGHIKIKDPFWAPTVMSINDGEENRFSFPVIGGRKVFSGCHGLLYEVKEVRECLEKGLTESPKMSHEDTLTIAKWQADVLNLINKDSSSQC